MLELCGSAQLLVSVLAMLDVGALSFCRTSESVGDSGTRLVSGEDIVAHGLRWMWTVRVDDEGFPRRRYIQIVDGVE